MNLVGRWTEASACEGILSAGGGEGWCAGRRAGTREQEDALLGKLGFVIRIVDDGGEHGRREEGAQPTFAGPSLW